jgi:hypothetical protein
MRHRWTLAGIVENGDAVGEPSSLADHELPGPNSTFDFAEAERYRTGRSWRGPACLPSRSHKFLLLGLAHLSHLDFVRGKRSCRRFRAHGGKRTEVLPALGAHDRTSRGGGSSDLG